MLDPSEKIGQGRSATPTHQEIYPAGERAPTKVSDGFSTRHELRYYVTDRRPSQEQGLFLEYTTEDLEREQEELDSYCGK